MPPLRDRLLEALADVGLSDLTDTALVEVLIEELKRTKRDLFEAQATVIKEGMRANDIHTKAREEIHRLRTDPLAKAQGEYYFSDHKGTISYVIALIDGKRIHLARREGHIDYAMRQLSAEEFERATR